MSPRGERTEALGRALLSVWGDGPKKSYKAKNWHAQFSKLTEVSGGSAAATAAGLDPSESTAIRWLKDIQEPSKKHQDQIARAYAILAGTWQPANETREYRIYGKIDSGDRVETRTLIIDGRNGMWDRIRDEYNRGGLTAADAEELFVVDVIIEDIGEGSEGWAFPGTSYTV